MKVLIASDKFKGSLTAVQVADAIATGLGEVEGVAIRKAGVSDGGDGLVDTLVDTLGGQRVTREVAGPLGAPVAAEYGWFPERRLAVVEMARASGLALLPVETLDLWQASSYGTGELIRDAVSLGAQEILLGIGGSATNDGGSGMALALGFRFLDHAGQEVRELPARLPEIARIEAPEDWGEVIITVACDVTNPLGGPQGATRVYGPQKGIVPDDFERFESRFAHLVSLFGEDGERFAAQPGAGAAGGLGFGSLAFLGATLRSGFQVVSEAIGLEETIRWADWVITGEGSLDEQSLQGKAPYGVVQLAHQHGKRTAAFCGRLGDKGLEAVFGPIYEVRRRDWPLEKNMAQAAELVEGAARQFAQDHLLA